MARNIGHRYVDDIEVFLADQVQQQVERTFKGLEKNLQRIRRDIQVQRQRIDCRALEDGEGEFFLKMDVGCSFVTGAFAH